MSNRYIPLSQTILRALYPNKEIFVIRTTIKQIPFITYELKENIELIDADFTIIERKKN